MNGPSIFELERAYKEANAWLDELYDIKDFFMLDAAERKEYRKALARAKFDRETALIELDAAFVPHIERFAQAA